ncbi:MAG: hypothetical protein Q9177_004339 [Variospora cf. flavescens]
MSIKPTPASIAPVSKRKSRPSFLDLFVSEAEIVKLRGELQLRKDRRRAAAAAAAATPTPEPAADAAAAAAAAAATPEAPAPEEAAKPAEEAAKPAEAPPKAPWAPAEDVALLSLKAQNKTWKEIGDLLVGRDKDELRNRYKEIGGPLANAGEGGGGASGGGEAAKDGATAAEGQSNGEKSANKGKQQKGDGGGKNKGKGKQGEGKGEPAAGPAAAAAGPTAPPTSPTNPNEAVVADRKDASIKGILRRGSDGAFQFGEAAVPNGATTLNGCPIIYLEENDPLSIDELSFLYNMNCAFEEQRWIRMASKFFDQTGKRIEPEWLRDKLRNCM